MHINTLFGRITLYLLILLALSLVLFYWIVVSAHRSFQKIATQHSNRNLAKNIIIDQKLASNAAINASSWKMILHSAMIANPMIDLYFIDHNGIIRNYALRREQVRRDKIDIGPVKQFLQPNSMLPIYGDNPRTVTGKKLFSAAPLVMNGKVTGYLYIILNHDASLNETGYWPQFLVIKSTFLTIAIVVLFLLSSALLIFKLIFRRVETLASTMQHIKQTRFTESPEISQRNSGQPDEVDKLGAIFRELVLLAQQRMQELNRQDSLRRDLIAQICHDIRTPLTSLNGNIDTLLLQYEQLDDQQIKQFLTVSARQGQVIVKLVEDLFLLSRLDDPDYKPHTEIFCINELIHDTIGKYSIQLKQKVIKLDLADEQQLQLVSADIGMIQRLLDNLLENALKFTVNFCAITVSTRVTGNEIVLQVDNDSPQLEPGELARMFDKFYRVQRSQPSTGSGLGLAICKRIVESHGGKITAYNLPNRGIRIHVSMPIVAPRQPRNSAGIFEKNNVLDA